MQLDEAYDDDQVPALQLRHVVEARLLVHVPGEQFMHMVPPIILDHVPILHELHPKDPTLDQVPSLQK